jgi:hypothetical protein
MMVNNNIWLVGGFNHLEKYEFVNGKDDILSPSMAYLAHGKPRRFMFGGFSMAKLGT